MLPKVDYKALITRISLKGVANVHYNQHMGAPAGCSTYYYYCVMPYFMFITSSNPDFELKMPEYFFFIIL